MVTATDIETLKTRVINGNQYCNNLWQKAKFENDPQEYENIMAELTKYAGILRELVEVLTLSGYTECVFGNCKWNETNYICFGCTKR